jgi:hypothetical protein
MLTLSQTQGMPTIADVSNFRGNWVDEAVISFQDSLLKQRSDRIASKHQVLRRSSDTLLQRCKMSDHLTSVGWSGHDWNIAFSELLPPLSIGHSSRELGKIASQCGLGLNGTGLNDHDTKRVLFQESKWSWPFHLYHISLYSAKSLLNLATELRIPKLFA